MKSGWKVPNRTVKVHETLADRIWEAIPMYPKTAKTKNITTKVGSTTKVVGTYLCAWAKEPSCGVESVKSLGVCTQRLRGTKYRRVMQVSLWSRRIKPRPPSRT